MKRETQDKYDPVSNKELNVDGDTDGNLTKWCMAQKWLKRCDLRKKGSENTIITLNTTWIRIPVTAANANLENDGASRKKKREWKWKREDRTK